MMDKSLLPLSYISARLLSTSFYCKTGRSISTSRKRNIIGYNTRTFILYRQYN